MSSLFAQSELKDLIEKVERGERLDSSAGVRMMNSQDILALGYMANLVRERKNGNRTYFRVAKHINYTNVCSNLGEEADFSEIHLMGEFNPKLPFQDYVEMLQQVRRIWPQVSIQAFTALEVNYFTQSTKLTITEILYRLMEAGLDSLSGSRAEVFSPSVKGEMSVSEGRYLEIQEAAHRTGMRTYATMLYGHVESTEERIDHLLKLRELQDRTGGFLSFMPLSFGASTGFEDLKILSVSRILLNNVDHIKAFCNVLGPKLAQVSLSFGVDDLDNQVMTRRALIHLIEKARREAVEWTGKESSACKRKPKQ